MLVKKMFSTIAQALIAIACLPFKPLPFLSPKVVIGWLANVSNYDQGVNGGNDLTEQREVFRPSL